MDDPVATLRADTDHGSAWLSLFALDALRERAAAKVAPAGTTDPDLEPRDPTALYGGSAAVAVHSRTFDRTPPALVETVVTERGTLDAAGVRSVAETHATMAAWDE
jgi:hypothetical protein